MLRRNVFDWELLRVSDFLRRLYWLKVCVGAEDRRIWQSGKGDEFSIKSCYDFFILTPQESRPWKEVWCNGTPPKVQFFMWTVVWDNISTVS